MSVLFLETPIKASPDICYQLSLHVGLHQLSTKNTGEYIVGGVHTGIMQLGDTVTWKARHFGIWQTLTSQLTEAHPYLFFVDEMRQGAFASMKHEHFFIKTDYGTLMKDIFIFESPLGWIGKLVNFLVLERYMRQLLTERNATLKAVAESDSWQAYITP